MLFALTFGIADFGSVFFQYQALNAATEMATRLAATRAMYNFTAAGFPDCGVVTAATPGTPCSQVAGSTTWTPVVCSGAAAAANCNAAVMNRLVTEMQKAYPAMTLANLVVTYRPSGLGFVGLGKPVPLVTVTITGIPARFVVLSAFGLNNVILPNFNATIPAEDLTGT